MQNTLIRPEAETYLRRLRFPKEVESAFQASYYERVRPTVRLCLVLLAFLSVLSATAHLSGGFIAHLPALPKSSSKPLPPIYLQTAPTNFALGMSLVVAALNVGTLGFAFHRKFPFYWQPCLAVTVILSLNLSLNRANYLPITGVFAVFYGGIIWFRLQRLQFRWMAFQCLGTTVVSYAIDLVQAPREWGATLGTTIVFSLLASVPLLFISRYERQERKEFWAFHSLSQERNEERTLREQSEQMLRVLSQAIGGIVHDLGNPLTSVQTGAETLLHFVKEGEVDRELVQEFAEIITDGAQMLNYLRLSLMEQTRVLEGKPVPVELQPTSLRHLVQSGTHYQKPKFASGRTVSVVGEDVAVCVDEMRFVTIFMNLIGNALKYSAGEVRVTWRALAEYEQVLIAVQDQGRAGQGISQAQAEKLFVAFGRLDTHAQVEGTGLGLLSVRKIAQAHAGEVYIEGYTDGVAGSAPFSTAQGTYPSLLEDGFCTAFVTVCPLHVAASAACGMAIPIHSSVVATS